MTKKLKSALQENQELKAENTELKEKYDFIADLYNSKHNDLNEKIANYEGEKFFKELRAEQKKEKENEKNQTKKNNYLER